MAAGTSNLIVLVSPDFKSRLAKVARFTGDGTVSSYVRALLERRVEEDEQILAPILERLAQEHESSPRDTSNR